MKNYLPDLRAKSIFELNYDKLKDMGIKGILIDIDNTLVPMHIKTPTIESIKWVKSMKKRGFAICILSNASYKRTSIFKDILNIEGVGMAFKPKKDGYLKAIEILNLKKDECVMIGDQLFTDIKGASKLKILTILTELLDENEHLYVKFKRIFEKIRYKEILESVKWI